MNRDHRVVAPSHHCHHRFIAVANPPRGLAADAASVADVVRTSDLVPVDPVSPCFTVADWARQIRTDIAAGSDGDS